MIGALTFAFMLSGISVAPPGFVLTQGWGGPQVVVNGRLLSVAEVGELSRIACGAPIPNGRYWMRNDGVWGYAGNPVPQGNIRDGCAQTSRRPGLSERGLLYSPGELLR